MGWNKRLLTTAGHCKTCLRGGVLREPEYLAEIHLSTKVIDCEERLQKTLVCCYTLFIAMVRHMKCVIVRHGYWIRIVNQVCTIG